MCDTTVVFCVSHLAADKQVQFPVLNIKKKGEFLLRKAVRRSCNSFLPLSQGKHRLLKRNADAATVISNMKLGSEPQDFDFHLIVSHSSQALVLLAEQILFLLPAGYYNACESLLIHILCLYCLPFFHM